MAKKESSTMLGYEDKLWLAADKLRGSMDSSEYKHVALGLIFLKYVSDAFEVRQQQIAQDEYADPEDKDDFFGKTYNVYNATMIILCSVIILFNVPLARFLYAKDFFEAWRYSSVLLISIMFNALTMFVGSVFAAVKKTKVIAWTTVISATCNTILNSLLIPVLGPLGAAIATAAAYGVMWIVRMIYSRRFIHFKTNLVRDCLMYGVVCLQVICEHLQGHFYIGQVGCLMILIIVYRKTIWTILDRVVVKRFK